MESNIVWQWLDKHLRTILVCQERIYRYLFRLFISDMDAIIVMLDVNHD